MHPISIALGLSDIFFIEDETRLTPTSNVPCFEGWKKGEMTAEHRSNLSLAARKRKRSPEHIAALHAGRRNSKNSIEHTAAVVKSRKGSKHSELTKEKMRAAKASSTYVVSNETKQKLKLKRQQRNTPEYKQQQAQKMRLVWEARRLRSN